MKKLIYIDQNPIVKGFCESALPYPYSGVTDYAGGQGKLKLALLY